MHSIPQLVGVDDEPTGPSLTPAVEPLLPIEPVPDTPEAQSMQRVLTELEKIPDEEAESTPPPNPDDSTMAVLMDVVPKLLEAIGMMQQSHVILTSVQILCKTNHKEIHALQTKIKHLEGILAGRPAKEGDPETELPLPSILSPANAAPGFEDIELP